LSHPSLTISTNSSSGPSKAFPVSPIAATTPTPTVVAPAARNQGSDLDTSAPQLASENEPSGRRTPELAMCPENTGLPELALCPEPEPPCGQTLGAQLSSSPLFGLASSTKRTDIQAPSWQSMDCPRRPSSLKIPLGNRTPEMVHRSPEAQKGATAVAQKSPKRMASAPASDENTPPRTVEEGATAPATGKEANGAIVSGRSGVAKMCSYWEERTRSREPSNAPGSARLDGLGGSLRNSRTSSSSILRERHSEARRFSGSSSHHGSCANNREARSASATLAREGVSESRRCLRRAARQQRLTDELASLMQIVCPGEADSSFRSSGSESEPLAEEAGDNAFASGRGDDENWFLVIEKENKMLNKQVRQYTRLLSKYLQKRPHSCGPAACPRCMAPLACRQCGWNSPDSDRDRATCMEGPFRDVSPARAAMRQIAASGAAQVDISSLEFKMMEGRSHAPFEVPTATSGGRNDRVEGEFASWDLPISPTSPPSAQVEEPAGEPDSGLSA
jgi:hypothetical protein